MTKFDPCIGLEIIGYPLLPLAQGTRCQENVDKLSHLWLLLSTEWLTIKHNSFDMLTYSL